MTTSANDRRAGPFTVGTVFPFDFSIYADTDVRVVQTDVDGVESDLIIDVDYTVAVNSDQPFDPGGDVTKLSAIPAGGSITLIGNLEFSQPLDIQNLSGYKPRTVMVALDRLTALVQQAAEQISRAILLPISSTLTNLRFPLPEIGKFLRGNTTGDGFENADIGALGAIGLPVSIAQGGTGATTAAAARTALGLASGATTTVGTAATLNVGVAANNILQLNGSAQIPAVDGSLITGLSTGVQTVLPKVANYVLAAGDRAKEIEFTTAGFNLTLLAPATAGNGFTVWVSNAASSGDVTLVGTVDGIVNRLLRPGCRVLLRSDGTVWRTLTGKYKSTSGDLVPALSTVYTQAHGLGKIPVRARAYLRCTTINGNWAVGDIIDMFSTDSTYGWALGYDATNVFVTMSQTYAVSIGDKTTAAGFTITLASWRLVIEAIDEY